MFYGHIVSSNEFSTFHRIKIISLQLRTGSKKKYLLLFNVYHWDNKNLIQWKCYLNVYTYIILKINLQCGKKINKH